MVEKRRSAHDLPKPGGDPRSGSRLRAVYYIAAAALALLVPLILFGGLWIRQEFTKNQRELEDYLEARATGLVQRADAEIRQEITVLQAIAALPSLDEPDLQAFQQQAARMVAAMPQWRALALVDPATGRQIVNSTAAPGADFPPPAAPELVRRIAETRQAAVQTGDDRTEALYAQHVVLLFVPVVRDNAVRQVLVAAMAADTVQQILTQQSTDPRLLLVIVDERDRILARSRAPEQFVKQAANEELRRATSGRAVGLFVAPAIDDQSVFTSFRRSPLTDWLFVVAADRQQFQRFARRSTWTTIATGALSLTLAAILAVFLFYNVMERRVNAERLAASRALSDLDARLLATTQEALAEQRKAASEREVLLREIYHRVKNNLQIVQSLLRLGSRDLGPDQREPFEGAVRRIGAMARVHTLLYSSPDLGSIDFKDYLEGLLGEVGSAFGADQRGIRTVLAAAPMRVPLDTAIPLAFVAVELLTNAFRHAFPGRGGTITIEAGREQGRGVLVVSDDGVGVAPSKRATRTLGLTIVAKLVQQIDGRLEQAGNGGAIFRVEFPLDPSDHGSAERPDAPPLRLAAAS
jgi:two-component sensor histidine kinase